MCVCVCVCVCYLNVDPRIDTVASDLPVTIDDVSNSLYTSGGAMLSCAHCVVWWGKGTTNFRYILFYMINSKYGTEAQLF